MSLRKLRFLRAVWLKCRESPPSIFKRTFLASHDFMFDYDSAAVWPNSSVTKFICTKPFPLNCSKCKASINYQRKGEETITAFSGLRRCKTIGEEVESDFKWLQIGGCKSHLTNHRLVTLTDAGGCGKTRLALKIANDLVLQCPDGVWLVELASIAD